MKFQDLNPGRYPCRITDWTLSEVDKLGGALKLTIQLSLEIPDSEPVIGRWEGFLKRKDGGVNENTIKTLDACGFKSTDIYTLATDGDALDTQKMMEATVEKDEKGYTKIKWLNSGSRSALPKKPIAKKKDLAIEAALAKALKDKKPKKSKDADDDLSFL